MKKWYIFPLFVIFWLYTAQRLAKHSQKKILWQLITPSTTSHKTVLLQQHHFKSDHKKAKICFPETIETRLTPLRWESKCASKLNLLTSGICLFIPARGFGGKLSTFTMVNTFHSVSGLFSGVVKIWQFYWFHHPVQGPVNKRVGSIVEQRH